MRLIAHRGSSGNAPENTMAAFLLALEQGAGAVEFDVHQTKDGQLAVIHDPDLGRVNGSKARVKNLTLKDLQGFDVGSWFAPRFQGERVPGLEEVLGLGGPGLEFHLELKHGSSRYPGIEERALRLVRRLGMLKRVVISSFDHKALRRVRALDKGARIGYLRGLTGLRGTWRETEELGAESLNISARQASAGLIEKAHERGLKVLVYTVNTIKDARRLKLMGADAIFTNFPELKIK